MDNEKEGFPITAIREIMILKRLNHKNILRLIEIVTSKPKEKNKFRGNVYLVFEYMEHDFSGLFKKFKPNFTIPQIKCILYQILCGIGYLHKCNIIHRDIKSANILLNNNGEVKVGDFGLARIINPNPAFAKQYTNRVVTLWYRAPELLLGDTKYGFGIDVWSIGCVFSELLTGIPLFDGMKEEEQIDKIFRKCGTPTEETWPGVTHLSKWKIMCPKVNYPNILREYYKNNDKVDDVAFDLLNKMLSLDPKKRITVSEALKHPYFGQEHKPVMCKPEELPKMECDSHEYQSRKEYKTKSMIIAANNNINILNVIANIMLNFIILFVNFDIFIALGILFKSSLRSTISDASIVASEPIPPIAIPISDNLITGASFIPSPTKAVVKSFFISFILSTLSCGNKFP